MNKEADWLLRELPGLVSKGLLDEPAAQRLRTHYARSSGPTLSWGMILLAIGGAALVGLGIILIFAHNWDSWTPSVRVALSLLPLLAGQLAAAQALRSGSRAWCEGAGVFTALAIGAAIALIAQTYQFGGDLPRFILTWTLLALPLVYLLDASAVAGLCWLGALGWTLASGDLGWWSRHETLQEVMRLPMFLLLATLPLPHLLQHIRLHRDGTRVAWLMRIALVVLVIGYGVSLPDRTLDTLLFTYAGMAAVATLSGRLWFADVRGLWGNPQFGAGLIGACGIALLATTHEMWHGLDLIWSTLLLPAAALALLALWMAYRCWQHERTLLAPALALLTPLLFLLAALGKANSGIAAFLGHLYALALAAALIRSGLQQAQLGMANVGVLLVAALVLLRFFDSDLSYVVRGVGFVIVGVGFFVANLWLRRRLQRGAA